MKKIKKSKQYRKYFNLINAYKSLIKKEKDSKKKKIYRRRISELKRKMEIEEIRNNLKYFKSYRL